MTVFAEIGGAQAVEAVVDQFYQYILADPELVGYFEGVNVDRLKHHQRVFVTAALGGPISYEGREMKAAHAHLGITNTAFSLVVTHLASTLLDLGVSHNHVGLIAQALIPYKDDVVTVPDPPLPTSNVASYRAPGVSAMLA